MESAEPEASPVVNLVSLEDKTVQTQGGNCDYGVRYVRLRARFHLQDGNYR